MKKQVLHRVLTSELRLWRSVSEEDEKADDAVNGGHSVVSILPAAFAVLREVE